MRKIQVSWIDIGPNACPSIVDILECLHCAPAWTRIYFEYSSQSESWRGSVRVGVRYWTLVWTSPLSFGKTRIVNLKIYRVHGCTFVLFNWSANFREVPRTAGVSTTDLVGRMLLMTRGHFGRGDKEYYVEKEGSSSMGLDAQARSPYTGCSQFLPTTQKIIQFSEGKEPKVWNIYYQGTWNLTGVVDWINRSTDKRNRTASSTKKVRCAAPWTITKNGPWNDEGTAARGLEVVEFVLDIDLAVFSKLWYLGTELEGAWK